MVVFDRIVTSDSKSLGVSILFNGYRYQRDRKLSTKTVLLFIVWSPIVAFSVLLLVICCVTFSAFILRCYGGSWHSLPAMPEADEPEKKIVPRSRLEPKQGVQVSTRALPGTRVRSGSGVQGFPTPRRSFVPRNKTKLLSWYPNSEVSFQLVLVSFKSHQGTDISLLPTTITTDSFKKCRACRVQSSRLSLHCP